MQSAAQICSVFSSPSDPPVDGTGWRQTTRTSPQTSCKVVHTLFKYEYLVTWTWCRSILRISEILLTNYCVTVCMKKMFQKYFFLIHYSVTVWNISVTFGTISNRFTVRKVSATYHRQLGTSMCKQCLLEVSESRMSSFLKTVLYIVSLVIGWVFKN